MKNCGRKAALFVAATLGAGSTASPYFYQVGIALELCQSVCADNVPVFNPVFSLVGVKEVGTGQYVATLHVEGVVSYVPCCGGCRSEQMVVSEDFTIPIAATALPTVTITQGVTVNSLETGACQDCTKQFRSATPLSVAVAES